MATFNRTTRIAAPAEFAFAWHERPGAFERLAPPWEEMEVLEKKGTIRDGDELMFRVKLGGLFWQRWHARHFGYIAGKQFCDEQLSGPFASWKHVHRIESDGPDACVLHDEVEYHLPLEPLSNLTPRFLLEDKIEAMFNYRTAVTKRDIEHHFRTQGAPKRILISGASGMVGTALTAFLQGGGHTVEPLLRRGAKARQNSHTWDPVKGFDADALGRLEGIDAVIHLAGENVFGVWTETKKKAIRESRVLGTRTLAEALAKLKNPPKVFIPASAVGYYGETGDTAVDETGPMGSGFLAEVARDWEAAAKPAIDAGIRTANMRIGVVMSAKGGALAVMRTPFTVGVGGNVGNGRQWMSWVELEDVIGLFYHVLLTESVSGAVNTVAPFAVTNAELTRTLGRVLGRPTFFPVPAFLVGALPGGMGEEIFLRSVRVVPKKALDTGYKFIFPDLEVAIRSSLGRL